MQKDAILITGACGEIGQALLRKLSNDHRHPLVTVDLKPLPESLKPKSTHFMCDLLDSELCRHLEEDFQFDTIFHLAAVLSTTAEHHLLKAHQVNTDGTLKLLELAAEQSASRGKAVKFLFPSSIAVYGLPNLETKETLSPLKEGEWTQPITMYGCTKLYCENLGRYYSENYRQLDDRISTRLDFRALRFPGLISAFTVPSGGTSDYGPEMVHAAAKGEPYHCFVRPEVKIPFMAMPDAVQSLLMLARAPLNQLHSRVYNVTSFSLSAREFKEMVQTAFPDARIDFQPDPQRQQIVDSWPALIDDSAARKDWGWQPVYDAQKACKEYLLPNIRERYHA